MACLRVSEREATEVAKELATSLAPADLCQRALHLEDRWYHVLPGEAGWQVSAVESAYRCSRHRGMRREYQWQKGSQTAEAQASSRIRTCRRSRWTGWSTTGYLSYQGKCAPYIPHSSPQVHYHYAHIRDQSNATFEPWSNHSVKLVSCALWSSHPGKRKVLRNRARPRKKEAYPLGFLEARASSHSRQLMSCKLPAAALFVPHISADHGTLMSSLGAVVPRLV
jgi:hypothetical protein